MLLNKYYSHKERKFLIFSYYVIYKKNTSTERLLQIYSDF